MAFFSIPDAWIQVGQAITQRLWQRAKDNFDAIVGQVGTLIGSDILNGFFEIVIDIAASPLRPLNWTVIEYLGGTVELAAGPSDPAASEPDPSARDYAVPLAAAAAAGALALTAGAWYARRRLS